jgi:hypothetical protein
MLLHHIIPILTIKIFIIKREDMKKLFLILVMLLSTLTIYSQEFEITFNELPNNSQAFLVKYYNDSRYANPVCWLECEGLRHNRVEDFVVKFDNGTIIEFDKHGSLESIDAGLYDYISPNILPNSVRKELKKINHKRYRIVEYNIDKRRLTTEYEVELSNGIEFKFNKKGVLKEIND